MVTVRLTSHDILTQSRRRREKMAWKARLNLKIIFSKIVNKNKVLELLERSCSLLLIPLWHFSDFLWVRISWVYPWGAGMDARKKLCNRFQKLLYQNKLRFDFHFPWTSQSLFTWIMRKRNRVASYLGTEITLNFVIFRKTLETRVPPIWIESR